jgi:cobalt/nickel transport system ATP-binding protein
MSPVPALEIADLHYNYPDGTAALNGITLAVRDGERIGIIGANGAGKSTLLLHLNGVLRGRGMVRVFGEAAGNGNLAAIRCKVGMVFQNPDDQLFCPTICEDVAFGPRNMRLPEAEVRHRVDHALKTVGIAHLKHKSPFHLSMGQKKRAALATVLSMDAQILALDEPTSNLDPRGRRELIALLQNFARTQIIATHDLDLVRCLCTRVILLDAGKIIADTIPDSLLDNHELLEAHGL